MERINLQERARTHRRARTRVHPRECVVTAPHEEGKERAKVDKKRKQIIGLRHVRTFEAGKSKIDDRKGCARGKRGLSGSTHFADFPQSHWSILGPRLLSMNEEAGA
eukprot:6198274-Pleurochrysis_carterae.AAC.2